MPDYSSMPKAKLIQELQRLQSEISDLKEQNDTATNGQAFLSTPFPSIKAEDLAEGVWCIDKNNLTSYVNTAMANMLKYTPQEMIGRPLFEFMTPEAKHKCQSLLTQRRQGKKEVHEFEFLNKIGDPVYTKVSATPVLNETDEYEGAIASIVDITEYIRLQKQLSASFDNAPIGIFHMRFDGIILKANNAFCEQMEYSPEELQGMHLLDFTHPDDKEACATYKKGTVNGEKLMKLTKRHISKSGKTKWTNLTLAVGSDEPGSEYLIGMAEDVTEAEEMGRHVNRLTSLLEETQTLGRIGGWDVNLKTGESFWTHSMYDLFGYTPEEIEHKHHFFIENIVHPDDTELIQQLFGKVIQDNVPISTRFRVIRKDGEERIIQGVVVPEKNGDGQVRRVYGANQDVTESALAEEKLRLSEQRLLTHYELGLVGMAMLDANKNWVNFNDRFCDILGYTPTEVKNKKWSEFTHPDDIEEDEQAYTQLLRGEIDHYELNKRYIRKDGKVIHATVFSKCIRDTQGKPEFIIKHVMDITERVNAEQEVKWNLKVSMSLARLYAPLVSPDANLQTASEAILREALAITNSKHGYVCTVNQGVSTMHTFSDMMGQCNLLKSQGCFTSRSASGEMPVMAGLWDHVLESRKPLMTNDLENHPLRKGLPEGHIPLTNVLAVPVMLEGNLVGLIAVSNKDGEYGSHDLEATMRLGDYFALADQRVKDKDELLASKMLMEKILAGIKAGIMVIDPDTRRIESINTVALEMLGTTREAVLGKTCDVLCWQDKNGSMIEGCPAKMNTVADLEFHLRRPDKEIVPISKTVIKEELGGQPKFIEILFDISKRKELERSLSLAQKLESIGQLSAGIAHEINTPAQYLGDNLRFFGTSFKSIINLLNQYHEWSREPEIKEASPELYEHFEKSWDDVDMDYLSEEIPEALSQSQDGIQRIISIVQAMKRFSHPGVEGKQYADINEALENTATVCRNEWKYYAELSIERDDSLPPISGFFNDLNQVFLNIIVNAAQAIAEKVKGTGEQGKISIKTSRQGDWAVVEIKDSGVGIPKKVMPRIFDPFFTTKEVGSGTGQGLSLCHDIIVNKHGGTIDFTSRENVGTTCTIKLPLGTNGVKDAE